MIDDVSRQYASALYDLALEENEVELYYNNLIICKKAWFDNPEVISVFENPKISKDEQKIILKNVLLDVSSNFLYFFYVLIDHERFSILPIICEAFKELVDEYKKIISASVFSNQILSSDNQEAIQKALEKYYKKQVVLTYNIDKTLVAGIKIHCQSDVLDCSIKAQLANLKNHLMKGNESI